MVALIGAFNAVVDPYLVIGAPRFAGFNALKPATETHTWLAKYYLLHRAPYAGVMIGSSKVDIGLDPDSPAWPDDARPVFNYGVPGVGVAGSLDLLRRAAAGNTLRRALVFLEISEFMKPAETLPPDPPEVTGFRKRVQDTALATLSLDALWSSLATVAAQNDPTTLDMSQHGATTDAGFRADVAKAGYAGLFAQKRAANAEALRILADKLRADPAARFGHLDDLRDIIALCRQHRIALDLVIAPFHADYLDGIDHAGLWARYSNAKRALTRFVAAHNARSAQPVVLWDFLGYDDYATEAVPSPASTAGMRWFWEPNHFKRALGEKILAAVYRGETGYGVRLSPDMIEAHLADEAAAKARFDSRH